MPAEPDASRSCCVAGECRHVASERVSRALSALCLRKYSPRSVLEARSCRRRVRLHHRDRSGSTARVVDNNCSGRLAAGSSLGAAADNSCNIAVSGTQSSLEIGWDNAAASRTSAPSHVPSKSAVV